MLELNSNDLGSQTQVRKKSRRAVIVTPEKSPKNKKDAKGPQLANKGLLDPNSAKKKFGR